MPAPPLVLASTSPYRRDLLARLGLPFKTVAPGVDEVPRTGETPAATALRLAEAKAVAVAGTNPGALIIGSDQVADLHGTPIGKPGTHARATQQLRSMRGQSVTFHTAVCLLNASTGARQLCAVPTDVRFRQLSDAEIEAYLLAEQPYDCAGSAKIEGAGIALVDRVSSSDPSALIGLPLIALVTQLAHEGVRVILPA